MADKKYAYIAGQVKLETRVADLGTRVPTLEFLHYRAIVGMHSEAGATMTNLAAGGQIEEASCTKTEKASVSSSSRWL